MESTQNIKSRLKSVRNIGQITKAMELVAATRMRHSQELALNSRPYAYNAMQLLGTLASIREMPMPKILTPRPIVNTLFIIMTSDKGLAGSLNSAVIKKFENYVRSEKIDLSGSQYSFVAIGQKAKTYLERRKLNIVASFSRVGEYVDPKEAEPIADFIINGYTKDDFDSVKIFFTVLVTALQQDPVVRELFPVDQESIKRSLEDTLPRAGKYSNYIDTATLSEGEKSNYIVEPSISEVFETLASRLLKTIIYHQILEANASEHSARRVAMKNASENANEISSTLEIEYNKSRQAAITRELIEVTSGAQMQQ